MKEKCVTYRKSEYDAKYPSMKDLYNFSDDKDEIPY